MQLADRQSPSSTQLATLAYHDVVEQPLVPGFRRRAATAYKLRPAEFRAATWTSSRLTAGSRARSRRSTSSMRGRTCC